MICVRSLLLSAVLLVTIVGRTYAQSEEARPVDSSVIDELDRKARIHFQTGTGLFESGEYERAAEEFAEAYRLSNRPALLFNISLAYERLGNFRKAAELLRAYLVAVPNAENRGRLELRIQRIEERAEQKERQERAPKTSAAAPALGTVSPPPAKTKLHLRSAPVLTTIAVTGAGLMGLAVFGSLALVEKHEREKSCAPDCTNSELSTLRLYRTLADVGLGVALVGAVGGATWILLDLRADRNEKTRHARLLPRVSAGAASAVAQWSF